MHKPFLTFVEPEITKDVLEAIETLHTFEDFDYVVITNVSELFEVISKQDFYTDVIFFNVEQLYSHNNVNVVEFISSISTLLRCKKMYRNLVSQQLNNDPALILSIKLSSNLTTIKKIINMSSINGIFPMSLNFSSEDRKNALTNILEGNKHIPKNILSRLRDKNPKLNNARLSPRQQQILTLICERGASNKSIAKLLKIAESTVKIHLTHIFRKYGVTNRTQLALFSGD
jgi:DNA-binding CsgD family transcriptional regulator